MILKKIWKKSEILFKIYADILVQYIYILYLYYVIKRALIMKASEFVKKIKSETESFGDLGEGMRVVKGNVEIVDSYYYGREKAMEALKMKWTAGGCYFEYFQQEMGVTFEIIDSMSMLNATGRFYKNITTDGIVSITVKLIDVNETEKCCECGKEMDLMEHNYGTDDILVCIHCYQDAQI